MTDYVLSRSAHAKVRLEAVDTKDKWSMKADAVSFHHARVCEFSLCMSVCPTSDRQISKFGSASRYSLLGA